MTADDGLAVRVNAGGGPTARTAAEAELAARVGADAGQPARVGADAALTQPLRERWIDRPAGYRCFEAAFFVGHGRDVFERAAEELLHWQVKIRSGFDIEVEDPGRSDRTEQAGPVGRDAKPLKVAAGQRPTIHVRLGPFRLPEPARIVAVVESEKRRGFTYATEPGHPVTGEESFHLVTGTEGEADDRVFLVLRSASRPGSGIWRFADPLVRIAQVVYRRRYARALRT